MKAVDLPLLGSISRPTIHPDGSRAVFSRVHADFAADDYVGQLWSVALTGKPAPRRITRGFRDSAPQFSPDGTLVAFLRAAPGEPAQLHVVDAAGGEPVAVTDAPLGITDFRWHPAGQTLVFLARVPEPGRYGTVPGLTAESESARRITTLRYRSNGVGYTGDRRTQVFLAAVPNVWGEPIPAPAPSVTDIVGTEADAAAGTVLGVKPDAKLLHQAMRASGLPAARQLTAGDFDHSGLTFSADGSRLFTISARHDGRDTDLRSEVVELTIDPSHDVVVVEPIAPATDAARPAAAAPHAGTATSAGAEGPVSVKTIVSAGANLSISALTSAADDVIFLLATDVGSSGRDFVGRVSALYRVDPGSAPIRVTDPDQTDADEVDLDDTGGITALSDGAVLVLRGHRGRVELLRVNRGGAVHTLDCAADVVTSVAASGETIAAAVQSAGTSGDLVLVGVRPAGGEAAGTLPRRLTDFSAPLRATGLVPGVELTVTGHDGYPVHGWVHTPVSPGPHPVLLTIHGGPHAQYTGALFDETQVYVDAGYAVVLCNPRGSSGYGQAHARAIRQQMGTVDLEDVLDFLGGAVAAEPLLDPTRVGIMGGSYGGYLTAWAIAHDHRFSAAIVERGFLDPDNFAGTSDIGDFFGEEYAGTDAALLRSQSPQAVVTLVTTPTLVLHSAQDLRCPLPQGERYYSALKRGGVPTELVIFPGENHDLSRTGRPRHRLQRFEIILDWWARYLPTNANHTRTDEHDRDTGHPAN